VVSLDTGAITELALGGQARYLVSGHLLVVRDDTVWQRRSTCGASR